MTRLLLASGAFGDIERLAQLLLETDAQAAVEQLLDMLVALGRAREQGGRYARAG